MGNIFNQNILDLLNSFLSQIESWLDIPLLRKIKFISAILALLLLIVWIVLLIKTNKIEEQIEKYKTFWRGGLYEKRRSIRIWRNIERLIELDDEQSRRQVFILMNELLKEVLNAINSPGTTLIEKIKNLKIAELNESDKSKLLVGAYAYEKMSNNSSFNLETKEVKYFFKLYKQIFIQLDLLEE